MVNEYHAKFKTLTQIAIRYSALYSSAQTLKSRRFLPFAFHTIRYQVFLSLSLSGIFC